MARAANHELKNRILRNAFQLFCSKGYETVTTREIAASCGIERGLLHHYFSQKQEILFTYYHDFGDSLFAFAEEGLAGHDSLEVIATVHYAYYDIIFSRPEWVQLIVSILNSRKLTKIKIDHTIRSYYRQNRDMQTLDRDQVYLATLVMIGAEVELVLNMLDGAITMTVTELATTINQLFLTYLGKREGETDRIIGAALDNMCRLDFRGYEERFRRRYAWYEPIQALPV